MRSCWLQNLACVLGFLASVGCNPDRVLLRPGADLDAGPSPPRPACTASDECGVEAACFKDVCMTCEELQKTCDCPAGTTASKYLEGDCTACECLPECRYHSECLSGSLCIDGGCSACSPPACPVSCNWKWDAITVKRNGCEVCECAPPNECVTDAECPVGLQCYAGQQCSDGCTEPSCCRGNLCSLPGCGPPVGGDCVYVGCADGVCGGDPGCPLTGCKCTPGAADPWSCPNTCFATCQAD